VNVIDLGWEGREKVLTERRKEFLEAVVNQYNATGEPVHYTEVAKVIGVSKWTAYDMLTALAREGYLEVIRKVDRKEGLPGRSQVMFRPSPAAYKYAKPGEGKEKGHMVDWEHTRKELLKRLAEADRKGPAVLLKETLAELPHISNPLIFCAKVIAALLLAVWTVRKTAQTLMLLREVLSYLSVPEAALILLVGLALGYIWKSGRTGVTDGLNQHIDRYIREVKRMDEKEHAILLTFVEDVAARLAPEPFPS